MTHVHDATIAGRCCGDEPAADVLARLRSRAPKPQPGENPAHFSQRQAAWKRAIEREDERARNPHGTAREAIVEGTTATVRAEDGQPPPGLARDVYVLGPITPAEGAALEAMAPGPGFVERTMDALNMKGATMPKKKRASAKTGRQIIEVRFAGPESNVAGVSRGRWYVKSGPGWSGNKLSLPGVDKPGTIKNAVLLAKAIERSGRLAQVRIFTKDNRIQTERTYGKDPARRKG